MESALKGRGGRLGARRDERPEHLKALDIGVQTEEEIPAKSLFLVLLIMEASDQVIPGKVENLKPH